LWDGIINGSFFIICKYYNDTDAFELEGVVVTALGIKREKKALGYATTS
jgi:hypothetical protein